MRIVVFSDSHGNIRRCMEVIDTIRDVDMIIHLGDILRDVEDLKVIYPDIPIECVAGNNDFMYKQPKEKILTIEGKRIWITHGHLYRVKYEFDTIKQKAAALNVDGLLFGHTHQCHEEYYQGMKILNPGSISMPNNGKHSYGIIEIMDKTMHTCICTV